MLTADAAAEFGTHLAALLHGILDELAHTVLVKDLERVDLQDLLVEIDGQEFLFFYFFIISITLYLQFYFYFSYFFI